MKEALEQIAQITSHQSFLGVLKVPLASELTIIKRENFHIIQHLLAKMYMSVLVIFMFH